MILGTLYVVSAPSGAGKTSLVHRVAANDAQVRISISHTTRSMRPKEQDGINYYFIEKEPFTKMQKEGAFLESALVHGHYYGTSKAFVMNTLEQGFDVILEIDWQGAAQIRQEMPNTTTVFILPPSTEALRSRLLARAQDSLDTITQRLQAAHAEMMHYQEFDYLIINDQFDKAAFELQAIITAKRLANPHASQIHQQIITTLLAQSS